MSGSQSDTSDIGQMYRQYLQAKGVPLTNTNLQSLIAQSQREPGLISGLEVQRADPTAGATAPPNLAGASPMNSGGMPNAPRPLPVPPVPPSAMAPPVPAQASAPPPTPTPSAPQMSPMPTSGPQMSPMPSATPPPGQSPMPGQSAGAAPSMSIGDIATAVLGGGGALGLGAYGLRSGMNNLTRPMSKPTATEVPITPSVSSSTIRPNELPQDDLPAFARRGVDPRVRTPEVQGPPTAVPGIPVPPGPMPTRAPAPPASAPPTASDHIPLSTLMRRSGDTTTPNPVPIAAPTATSPIGNIITEARTAAPTPTPAPVQGPPTGPLPMQGPPPKPNLLPNGPAVSVRDIDGLMRDHPEVNLDKIPGRTSQEKLQYYMEATQPLGNILHDAPGPNTAPMPKTVYRSPAGPPTAPAGRSLAEGTADQNWPGAQGPTWKGEGSVDKTPGTSPSVDRPPVPAGRARGARGRFTVRE